MSQSEYPVHIILFNTTIVHVYYATTNVHTHFYYVLVVVVNKLNSHQKS
jgi:hypothetical protein